LIHAHLNRAALWSGLLGRLLGVPVIATAHGLTKTRYYRLANEVIAVSSAVQKHFLQHSSTFAAKTTTIHNGVALDTTVSKERLRQLRQQYLIHDDDRIISVIGKLHENKGQSIAIRALKALPPNLGARLFLIGDGPERTRLERLVSVLSLGPRVSFIPSQTRLQEFYALSDIVVVPSHREALSYVCLEALGQGRPVIASNTGGIPEIIEHGTTGLLVPPGDAEALAKMIVEGFRTYRRLEAMAHEGKRRVHGEFGLERWYDRTVAVYAKVLGIRTP